MTSTELINLYSTTPEIQLLQKNILEGKNTQIDGAIGSSISLILAATYKNLRRVQIVVCETKEEALYITQDLQHLLSTSNILLYPSSYIKPYDFEEIDNANVLQRSEVLNRLQMNQDEPLIVVGFPGSFTEKVISKKTLVESSLIIKQGEKAEIEFVGEVLNTYGFEKTDFVYTAGEYSIRGGIIDIFSYSNELPYRVELFGNEVESIRTFNPDTQLSVETKKSISIVPNIQQKILLQSTESFFDFVPKESGIWIKNYKILEEVLEVNFESALNKYKERKHIPSNLIEDPSKLFENKDTLREQLKNFGVVIFGSNHSLPIKNILPTSIEKQPLFQKDFKKIAAHLIEKLYQGYKLMLFTDTISQFDKLSRILEEHEPELQLHNINTSIKEGFIDHHLKLVCYTDHQLFDRFYSYKSKERFSKNKAITLKELKSLKQGDFVTHSDYGIAKFIGLEKIEINGVHQEAIRLLFKDNDLMKVSILQLHKISKYLGKEGEVPSMSKLGSPDWENKKKAVKRRVKELAFDLIKLYAKRKSSVGFAYSSDNFLQVELETSFIYEDTPDQTTCTDDVKKDMMKPYPMDRLVCGDVGFGKTEIAIRSAFKAACDNKQVAILVPTTILAMQHYKTFKNRLSKFPVKVDYVSRFRTPTQIKATLATVAEGKCDILIGTHRILGKDVKFKDLGLLIIDEEQKFGVSTKEKLRELKVNVDTLTLTATPIPRTLHFSLMGARDLSILSTPPPNRQPVTTEVLVFEERLIRDAIHFELQRNGQAFFVHNKISDIFSLADTIKKLVPEARIGVAHGQMEGETLEEIMVKFIEGDFDVLVSTNIIESGLDIPNANTIIINQAHHFGLSDLHQMRGRVGRSNIKAYCYLLIPPQDRLTGDAKKKLLTLQEFSELGDGIKVAMRDLDIRGAGNLLGAEQSGFITDIGFDLYHKLLDEAVQELKETEFKELFEDQIQAHLSTHTECVIETDHTILIPDTYVSNVSERLSLYNEVDSIKNEQDLERFIQRVCDRFGPLPTELHALVKTVKMRWLAEQIGFDKLILKQQSLKCQFFHTSNSEYFNGPIFDKILTFVQLNSKKCSLKEQKNKLVFSVEGIIEIDQAIDLLQSFAE